MAEQQEVPKGPDLRQGVQVAEVPDGAMIAGHVDDWPVAAGARSLTSSSCASSCPGGGGRWTASR